MNTIKTKAIEVAGKIANSKAYKAVEKVAVTGSAALVGAGIASVNSFASELDNTALNGITVNTAEILNMTQPFVTPAITVLCCVGGIKLGMRFLRSSMH